MIGLIRGILLKLGHPFLMIIGSFSRNKKERLQLRVIELNNRLVKAQWRRNGFRQQRTKILLLMPHCVQASSCDVRITNNVYNCKRCGTCAISSIIGVAEENDLSLFVATGGTIARRIVMDILPDAIVAVACERDLSIGIVDTYPLPVIGITNERPSGPCINTLVDQQKIKEAIEFFGKRG
jgi:hypothetical protein